MTHSEWAAWAGIVIVLLGGFWKISSGLAKLEVKIEILWSERSDGQYSKSKMENKTT